MLLLVFFVRLYLLLFSSDKSSTYRETVSDNKRGSLARSDYGVNYHVYF